MPPAAQHDRPATDTRDPPCRHTEVADRTGRSQINFIL
jgi:hypothetical protein